MKALIIDHHESSARILSGKLQGHGYDVVYEPTRNGALAALSAHSFDIIFIDPSPQMTARSYVRDIRRSSRSYPYIFLTQDIPDPHSFMKESVNDVFPKPFEMDVLQEKLSNAQRFLNLLSHMRNTAHDFPSAGGVISKSAFLQLFLSGLDRADRYQERSFLLRISIENYKEIRNLDGAYGADYSVARLSQHLVLSRRQSDIVGQTGVSEFSLLLLRPLYESEPMDAAARIAQALSSTEFVGGQDLGPIEIALRLVDLPTGASLFDQRIVVERSV